MNAPFRVVMTELRSTNLLSPPHSARSSFKQRSPRQEPLHSNPDPEAPPPTLELRLLRMQVSAASQTLQSLTSQYTQEVQELKETIETLRREVDLMRFERDEAVAREGEADIMNIANQVISMRTEIDRMSAFVWKSQRERVMPQKRGKVGRGEVRNSGDK